MSERTTTTPLGMTAEEMRRLGYEAIDRIVDHFMNGGERPVTRKFSRADFDARYREPVPETGCDAGEVLREAVEGILAHAMRVDHPRFFAYIPSPNNFVSVVADALAAGFNPFGGTWQAASGPTGIELVTLDWLRQMTGLPEGAGGIFLGGGSMANLIALATARHLCPDAGNAVVYASDQTHSSVDRGLRTLGFSPDRIRTLESDARFELRVDALERAVAEDRAAGRRPMAVVANAGTTNTGAVDPLVRIAEVCRREGLWLHADGAYGLGAIITGEGRRELEGIDLVDSFSFDPHKWWFQPIETACVMVRDVEHLRSAFSILPAYLRDTRGTEGEVNPSDLGLQLTRGIRALKVWMSLKTFGLSEFRRAVEHGLDLARHAEKRLQASPSFRVVTPARLGLVSFCCVASPELPRGAPDPHPRIVRELYTDGFTMLSSTTLRAESVLRLCPIHPGTTESDLDASLERLEAIARRVFEDLRRASGAGDER